MEEVAAVGDVSGDPAKIVAIANRLYGKIVPKGKIGPQKKKLLEQEGFLEEDPNGLRLTEKALKAIQKN
ncbi:hypothetical protein HYV44_00415 [Candidatus Microgenomates bacterium]|nr:hypothetical protein [Candidatus Microgenomates bacterium]